MTNPTRIQVDDAVQALALLAHPGLLEAAREVAARLYPKASPKALDITAALFVRRVKLAAAEGRP